MNGYGLLEQNICIISVCYNAIGTIGTALEQEYANDFIYLTHFVPMFQYF